MFGREEQSKMFNGSIMIGNSALERGEYGMAGLRWVLNVFCDTALQFSTLQVQWTYC